MSAEELCECGHPLGAHRVNYNGPKDPSGRGTYRQSCVATVHREDSAWPCPCLDFRPGGPVPEREGDGR